MWFCFYITLNNWLIKTLNSPNVVVCNVWTLWRVGLSRAVSRSCGPGSLLNVTFVSTMLIPKARLFGDKNCRKFKELMESYDWNTLYLSSPDLYRSFISVVKRFYEISFPMVTLSRSRMRGKPWVTKGLKKSIKNNHKLYKLYIRSGDEQPKSK